MIVSLLSVCLLMAGVTTDSVAVIGASEVSIGTIREEQGKQERSFWIRNVGDEAVRLVQGYTSCGCTTIAFERDAVLQRGDSSRVTLSFNPTGKGGEFYESGTVVYTSATASATAGKAKRHFVQMAMEGNCITSTETLMKQFPIAVSKHTRVSRNRFDLGYMNSGAEKTVNVVVLHCDENNRQELFPLKFKVEEKMKKGLQHITKTIETKEKGKKLRIPVTLDVVIR